MRINPLNFKVSPLLYMAILLSAGATVTWPHYGISNVSTKGLGLYCGTGFVIIHWIEYYVVSFTILDSVYGYKERFTVLALILPHASLMRFTATSMLPEFERSMINICTI